MSHISNIQASTPFKAVWNESNQHLKGETPVLTTAQKAYKIAYNIISVLIPVIGLIRLGGYMIQGLFNRILLPVAHPNFFFMNGYIREQENAFKAFWLDPLPDFPAPRANLTDEQRAQYNQKKGEFDNWKNCVIGMRNYFTPTSHKVETPDGAVLDVILMRHKDSIDGTTPTVLHFNPNAVLAKGSATQGDATSLMCESIDKEMPCNFVFFDYRGVGNSTGKMERADDLIIDGSSVKQWVKQELRTPDDQIHFIGRSLGGAVSVQTQALDETLTGCNININSFSSLPLMVEDRLGKNWLSRLVLKQVQEGMRHSNPAQDFAKLHERNPQKLLVIHHPHDQVIPPAVGLHMHAESSQKICLEPIGGDQLPFGKLSERHHHSAPLEWHIDVNDRINQLVFGPASVAAEAQ